MTTAARLTLVAAAGLTGVAMLAGCSTNPFQTAVDDARDNVAAAQTAAAKETLSSAAMSLAAGIADGSIDPQDHSYGPISKVVTSAGTYRPSVPITGFWSYDGYFCLEATPAGGPVRYQSEDGKVTDGTCPKS